MPSPKITPEQAAKQKAALQEMHRQIKDGTINIKNPNRKLSLCMKDMQPKAIEIILASLEGGEKAAKISKSQLDSAWKVVNSIQQTAKSESEIKIKKLQAKLALKQAQDQGVVKSSREQVQEQYEAKGLQPVSSAWEYEEEWDEEQEIPDEPEDDSDDE